MSEDSMKEERAVVGLDAHGDVAARAEIVAMDERYLPDALAVYRWYVQNSTATFQIGEPTLEQMRSLLFFTVPRYRSFAILSDGAFAGYGILTRFKEREAFDRTAEVTVYLAPERTGKGLGRLMLARLEKAARDADLHALVALVTGENAASRKLFERSGFAACARYREVGFKFGRALDLVCFEKIL